MVKRTDHPNMTSAVYHGRKALIKQTNKTMLRIVDTVWKAKYRQIPKNWDAKKLCFNLPKIQTKRPNLRIFCQNDAYEMAHSVDPDQTAPRGAVL